MLIIKNLKKTYGSNDNQVEALKGIDLNFNAHEFVSILGPSGCGKTTLLNIIGGLDRYTSGDILIDGISTKDYKDSQWDSYRNHKVGFVFQSYHLIAHLSVIENVELALTLSGYNKQARREKAINVLKKVGLEDQLNKKPNQLSGGQAQRVAIARALVNDPTIILADEPTGALDTTTSKQVMALLQEISKDKLIIMVTHNQHIAYEFSDRIIELLDGRLVSDSKNQKVNTNQDQENKQPIKKTSMSFLTAFKLSLKNLFTKKVRTLITALAGSIGIVGVGLVLSIHYGVNNYLDNMQKESLSGYPIVIQEEYVDFQSMINSSQSVIDYDISKVYMSQGYAGINNITQAFVEEQVETLDENLYTNMTMKYGVLHHFAIETTFGKITQHYMMSTLGTRSTDSSDILNSVLYESTLDHFSFNDQFHLIGGQAPQAKKSTDDYVEAVVFLDRNNRLPKEILNFLGYTNVNTNFSIDIDDFLQDVTNKFKIKLVLPNGVYQETSTPDQFEKISNATTLFNSNETKEVKIVGVYKTKEGSGVTSSPGFIYFNDVEDIVRDYGLTSNIIAAQLLQQEDSVILDRSLSRAEILRQVGGLTDDINPVSVPTKISIYPNSFDAKNQIRAYFDAYNNTLSSEDDKIVYIDNAELVISIIGEMVNMMTYVLVAFASISLVVSSIMIGIITYVSVVERTKEIGILRSLGARKKDISRVFNAEAIIIGLSAGIIGTLVVAILSPILSILLYNQANIDNLASFTVVHAVILIVISAMLTFIAGLFPSRIASLKDPVVALRTEN